MVGNFSNRTVKYALPEWVRGAETLLDNYEDDSEKSGTVTLKPYRAVILEMKA